MNARWSVSRGPRQTARLHVPRNDGLPRRAVEVVQNLVPRHGADEPELFDDGCTYVAVAPGEGIGPFCAHDFEVGG